jgi:MobA/MobL family
MTIQFFIMAIAFVKSRVAGRSDGKSAIAMAAYRSGDRIIDLASGKTHDYTKKLGVDHSEIISPVAATAGNEWVIDRQELWNRVEAGEKRYDAQLAREIVIAIPRELDRDDQIALVREYVQSSYVDRGMIADINLHHLDGDNPHAHVMLTMRELKIDEQGVIGFGNKDRTWNDKKLLQKQKLEWDGFANKYLERAGFDVRIDSRSYEEQGIDRIPQIHLGVAVSQMRAKGIQTDRGDLYDQIEQANADIRAQLDKIYEGEQMTRDAEIELAQLRSIEVTPPEIPKIEAVTHEIEITSATAPKRDLEQERRDDDLLFVAHNYPDLQKTPEYQAAKARSNARQQALIRSMPKPIPQPAPAPPAVKKWEPTLQQPTGRDLIDAIMATAKDLDANQYQAGNYQVQILQNRIEIGYKDRPAMVIDLDEDEPRSQLLDRRNTINQYHIGLGASLDQLAADRQEQVDRDLQARQFELQREVERQQQIAPAPEPEIEISFPAPERDQVRNPSPEETRDRKIDRGYER